MRLFRFCLLLLLPAGVFAQNQLTQSQLTLGRMRTLTSMGRYSSMDQVTPEGKLVGTPYLNEEWKASILVLKENNNERIEGYPVRYNIHADVFEIKVENEIKGLEGNRVKEYIITEAITPMRYVSGTEWNAGAVNVSGFVQVLSAGEINLIKKTIIVIKNPDYSVQFSVGSRDTQIIKKDVLYYTKGDSIFELPKSSKKLSDIFGDHRNEVSAYIEANDIKPKSESGLKAVFDYYNAMQ